MLDRTLAVLSRLTAGLLLVLPLPASAAEWTLLGPDGATVYSLALQPGSSTVLYAGTNAGVFKSTDGGDTWLLRSAGLPTVNVLSLAVDPARPDTLYAGLPFRFGIYKSTDGGAHWTDAGAGLSSGNLEPGVFDLAVAGGAVYAAADSGLFRSRDGGASWQKIDQGLPRNDATFSLEVDLTRPARIYAGLFGGGLYRSTDGGARWTRVDGTGLAGGGGSVNDIAVSPASPKIVYAASQRGVARSLDSGATWLPPGKGISGNVISLAPHPTLPGTVYAGATNGVFRSTDHGATWVRVSQGLGNSLPVLALAIAPASPATLWAGTDNGVFRTTDAGARWTFRSRGLSTASFFSLEVDPQTPGTLYAATAGLLRSRDWGLHWTRLPLPGDPIVLDVELDPVDSSIVYAASNGGPLLKSTDGGDTWTQIGPSLSLYELAIDPANPSVFHGGGFDTFYKSTDAGATWTENRSFLTPLQIEIAPGVLYAIARVEHLPGTPGINRTVMVRSRDAGQTWEGVLWLGQDPRGLAVSPSDPETVYASLESGAVLRTEDGGDTWQEVSRFSSPAAALAIAPGPPETLYVAVSNEGVFASTDGGATWSPQGEGLEGLEFGRLVLDPRDPARLWVTLPSRGLATLTLVQPEDCEPGPTVLCLQGGRFRVEVEWKDFQGNTGLGQATPMTSETGSFWFFEQTNVELVVKVLDGRDTNGKFWVFAASLTSVEFTLTVTDTETGKQKVYRNPSGKMASFGDTGAF